ncbi:hypothetical protein N431DRAFT_425487 [Stipitochalara longipes BDJ]|nr:hypothetical protein N431DRAFT_425487 [Stipitochalara longipes BDJ]
MVKKWQFVSNRVEDGAGKDEKTRKIVRKAAMKAFRKNQRLEQTKKFMQENGDQPEPRTLDEMAGKGSRDHEQPGNAVICRSTDNGGLSTNAYTSVGIFQPQSWNEFEVAASFTWPQEIVSLDPFGSSPLGACKTWHYLFMHFVYDIAPMIQPLGINSHLNPVNTQWARHAMSDPALFHGILFHASVHGESYEGKPWSPTTLFHRGETIRLVSERLSSSSSFPSDETLAAVAWVASEGNVTGVVEQDRVHYNALARMLKIRGGMQSLGWHGALELLLTLGNIIWSMVAGTPPMIERPTLIGFEFPDIPPSLIVHNTGSTLTVVEFGEELMSLLRFMSELTIAQSALVHTPGVTAEEIIGFNKLRSAVEHRLLSIRASILHTTSPTGQLEATVYEACRIAALLCSNCIFRDFKPNAVAVRGLKKALMPALNDIETNLAAEAHDFEEMLLWVYFIGGMLSIPTETEWFASRVAKAMASLNIEDWAEVERCLMRCLWTEKMQNKYCLAFWEEVESCRAY